MPISSIHAYLIHPGKYLENPNPVGGSLLPQEGDLFKLLSGIFHADADQRDVDFSFNPSRDGDQSNECRSLILDHMANSTVASGAAIATRLQGCTDNRSGLGLLFVLVGNHGLERRFVLSRFPAESAILAELENDNLTVQFLDRVFVKRANAYKAIALQHQNPVHNFWSGKATDRQIGSQIGHISNYWMADFLNADLLTTPAAGTRRLAIALQNVVKRNTNVNIQSEVAAAASLAPTALANRRTSIDEFCNHFGFGPLTREAVEEEVRLPNLRIQQFDFDAVEFRSKLSFRSVSLDNGAVLSALAADFENVFTVIDEANGRKSFTTIGRPISQRLRTKI